MADLINRTYLIRELTDARELYRKEGVAKMETVDTLDFAIEIVNNMEPAEHISRWVFKDCGDHYVLICRDCYNVSDTDTAYCCECGARMGGVDY